MAKRLGAPLASAPVYGALGDAGAASALLGLVQACADGRTGPGAGPATGLFGTIGYGGGRATAVVVEAKRAVPGAVGVERLGAGRRVSYAEALRARGQLEPMDDPIPMGLPPGGAAFVRGNPEMLGLFGARCRGVRDDLDPAVDPPHLHRVRRGASSRSWRWRAGGACTPSS